MRASTPPAKQPNNIWAFNQRLTQRLLLWSGLSVSAGAAMQLIGRPFWRGFGQQAMGWGVIDALIAWFGQRGAARKAAANVPGAAAKQRRQLRRLLWLNAGLDIFYMIGGLCWAQSADSRRRGHGWGIFVQGAFLFLFDLVHARNVAKITPRLE